MIVEDGYTDFFGRYRETPPQTRRAIVDALGSEEPREGARLEPVYVFPAHDPPEIPGLDPGARFEPGYYEHEFGGERSTLVAAPPAAYVPEALEERPRWGVAVQLYSLRSQNNWGIGDFGDLAQIAGVIRERGGACVSLNPLHALHLTNPRSASPYSPLSRLFLNPLYVDVPSAAAAIGASVSPRIGEAALRALRETELVDYDGVARAKLKALRDLHAELHAFEDALGRFRGFLRAGGERLRLLAVYQALMAHFKERNPRTYGWMQWPQEFQSPHTGAVQAFAAEHGTEVEFFAFLQWLADEQLARAAQNAAKMPIGLYRDLAVGVDAGSADVWTDREAFCAGISVGAPPDPMNGQGQNWGLPPFNPRVLRRRAYAPFVDLLRANMRHAGALRIDHVMGLMRLFCIPAGMPPSEGAYVRYPFDDMLGVLALESRRNKCMIVGEDLGTVPEGFRERMGRARVFSCRVLYFEHDPKQYPKDAVASTGTHDLPPLRKYWESGGSLPSAATADIDAVRGNAEDDVALHVVTETYRLLGCSTAQLVLAQIEDMLLQREQVNTPGTFDEVPNWQRKLPVDVGQLPRDARFEAVASVLREARPER